MLNQTHPRMIMTGQYCPKCHCILRRTRLGVKYLCVKCNEYFEKIEPRHLMEYSK